jgi:hypothetical protein
MLFYQCFTASAIRPFDRLSHAVASGQEGERIFYIVASRPSTNAILQPQPVGTAESGGRGEITDWLRRHKG